MLSVLLEGTTGCRATTSSAGLGWPLGDGRIDVESETATPLSEGTLTILGVEVSVDSLDAAEGVLGPSPLRSEGDASEGVWWRCWEAANGDGTVLAVARGELDGRVRLFGPELAFPQRGTCPRSDKVSRELATASGIRLGLSRAEIEQRVGPATGTGEGWYRHVAMSRRLMTDAERAAWRASPPDDVLTVSSGILVVEQRGRALGIQLGRSESD